ncbi:MAG: Fic/DOC family protein [Clostridia bacterium]
MTDKYSYNDTGVLVNKFDIKDPVELSEKERDFSAWRLSQLELNPIEGSFNLDHLKKIHEYIFQDIYPWAGEVRIVEISKGNSAFAFSAHLNSLVKDLSNKLMKENFLKDLSIDKFSERLAFYASEINAYHPFREGNGRATREFIRSLAKEAGYTIDYSEIDKQKLYQAFVRSFTGNSDELKNVFKNHIIASIKKDYGDKIPGIEKASESLLENLFDLKSKVFKGDLPTVKDINEKYLQCGEQIDSGELELSDPKFKLLSNTTMELRKLESYTKEQNLDSATNQIQAKDHSMDYER